MRKTLMALLCAGSMILSGNLFAGNALQIINGATGYVDSTSDIAGDDFSAMLWVKLDTTKTTQKHLISFGGEFASSTFALWCVPSTGTLAQYNGAGSGGTPVNGLVPTDGSWFHLAVVATKDAQLLYYVNGVAKTGMSGIGKAQTAAKLRLGLNLAGTDGAEGTQYDEVSVWDKVLSPAEITANYNAGTGIGLNGLESNLQLYWKCDEVSGNTVADSKNSGTRPGTISGTAATDFSWTVGITPDVAPVPPTVTAPVTTSATAITATGFTANWTASTTPAVNDYTLTVADNAAFNTPVFNALVGNVTTKALTGLSFTPATTFYYKVTATDGANTSPESNTISVVQPYTLTYGFEGPSDENWIVFSGTQASVAAGWDGYSGIVGSFAAHTGTDDANTGIFESPVITVTGGSVDFFQGGGTDAGVYFAAYLAADNTVIAGPTGGANAVTGINRSYDLDAYAGQNIYFRLVDTFTGGWGHAMVDDIKMFGAVDAAATTARRGSLAPIAPVANAATLVNSSSFTANWNAVGVASTYTVAYSVNIDMASSTTIVGVTDLFVSVPKTSNVNYYYTVTAVNAVSVESPVSNMVTVSPWLDLAAGDIETFDNGIPEGWATIGTTEAEPAVAGYNGWEVTTTSYYPPSNLTGNYASCKYYSADEANNDWLITPAIDVTVTKSLVLKISTSYDESFKVVAADTTVATSQTDVANFTYELRPNAVINTAGALTQQVIDLSSVVGKNVYIAIVYTDSDKRRISVDDVQILDSPVALAPVATAATTVTTAGFTATWNASSLATGYKLYVDGLSTIIVSSATTSQVVTYANDSFPYATPVNYYVIATNADGDSVASNAIEVLLPAPAVSGGDALNVNNQNITNVALGQIQNSVSTFTWETWVRVDAVTGYKNILARRIDHNNQVSIIQPWDAGNKLRFTVANAGARKGGLVSTAFVVGEWFHVAMVFDGSGVTDADKLKAYINGTLQTITFDEDGLPATTPDLGANPFRIGSESDNTSFHPGLVDEVRVWSTARTAAEIREGLHTPVAVDATGLEAYYQFTAGALNVDSATATDYALTGTITPATSGAMVNTASSYARSAYLWNGLANGISSRGLSITATTPITYDNTGFLYGIKAVSDVNGTTADGVSGSVISRLTRYWNMETIYTTGVQGSITFSKSTLLGDSNTTADDKFRLLKGSETRSATFTDTGIVPTVSGDDITFTGVNLETGVYTLGSLDNTLTPAVGITVTQDGTTFSWSVEDEIGVKQYNITVDGVTTVVMFDVDSNGFYSILLDTEAPAILTVVDNSGFKQSFMPTDGNVVKAVYNLVEGWNLIAMPGANADISALKTAIAGGLWGWTGSAYEIVTVPTVGNAVWVYAPSKVQVIITAEKVEAELVLESGWNMVGPTENMAIPVEAHTVYGWNETYQNIANDSAGLMQGVGYWIFAISL